jgi:hypothetical protein
VKACTGRPGIEGDDSGGKDVGFGGGGGLKTCKGRTTVCTTSGWLLMLLVPSGVVAALGAVWRWRMVLKMISPAAKITPKAMSLPDFVLKKLRKSRGFMAVLWVEK